jgi:hypothetical protein
LLATSFRRELMHSARVFKFFYFCSNWSISALPPSEKVYKSAFSIVVSYKN